MSRQWLTKIEQCELRLDLVHLIVMCRVYGLKAHELVQKMEEEPSDEGGFFLPLGELAAVYPFREPSTAQIQLAIFWPFFYPKTSFLPRLVLFDIVL